MRLAEEDSLAPIAALGFAVDSEPAKLRELTDWNRSGELPPRNGFSRRLSSSHEVLLDPNLIVAAQAPQVFAGGLAVRAPTGEITWGAKVRVDGAYRLRLHLAQVDLPSDSSLWVYSSSGETGGPVDLELLADDDGLWTPSVGGPIIHIEMVISQAEPVETPRFVIDEVLEIFQLDTSGQPVSGSSALPNATDCLVDAQCVGTGTFDAIELVQQAIAHLQYVESGNSYICTGGLLNDTDDATVVPYLLTANHCFSTQASTSSLEAFWDYYADSCLGSWPPLGSLPTSNGGTLLATSASSDFTFVQLFSIPASRVLLGWNADASAAGPSTTLHRVSHPLGAAQTYSQTLSYSPSGTCTGVPTSRYIYSIPVSGATAGGSSGAPVVLAGGYTVGQLLGACGPDPSDPCNPLNDQVDGRFSETYPLISQYLDPQVTTYTLAVAKAGQGSGTVTSNPGAIDCGDTCSDTFADGTVVTLAADAAVGSVFGGWSGHSDCLDGQVTMDADKNCTATFNLAYTLSVNKIGSGAGTVTGNPGAINCGGTCSDDFAEGTVVTLTAAPAGGSVFAGWSGDSDCSGGQVTMSADRDCTATFNLVDKTLSINKLGSGTGTVTSDPPGIDCGSDCSEAYVHGTVVVLTPTPAAGSAFGGWSGDFDCLGGSPSMTSDKSCNATFTLQTYLLSVSKAGTGDGTVTSTPAGIACGGDCEQDYPLDTAVRLTGTPLIASELTSWNGHADCSDGELTMSAARSCTATFNNCSSQSEVSFADTEVSAHQVVSACNHVYAGPNVQVTSSGVLDIYAGNSVTFYDGFEVQSGGEMRVILGQPMP